MKAKLKTIFIGVLALLDCIFGGIVINIYSNQSRERNVDIKASANYVIVKKLDSLNNEIEEFTRDKEAPTIKGVTDITIYVGEKVDFFENITIKDNADDEIVKNVVGTYDINKVGEYSLTYEAKDLSDNIAQEKFKLIVKEHPDTEAPKITGIKNITVYVGDSVNFYKNITVTDNKDKNVKKEVVGAYNLKKAGTYSLKYRVTDASGNVTTKKFNLIVKNKVTTVSTKTTAKVTGNKATYQAYAKDLCLNKYGWSEKDFENLVKLWNKESGWNVTAKNKSSGAYGIPQSLPASKMASEGSDYATNYKTQIRWGLKYIKSRYGNPTKAWNHSQAKGWY